MGITLQNNSISVNNADQLSISVNSTELIANANGKLAYANKNIARSVNGVSADDNGNIAIPDAENIADAGNAFTINASSEPAIVNEGATITIEDGKATEYWTKTIALRGSCTVTFGQAWSYIGAVPVLRKGLLVCSWNKEFGVISFNSWGQ